MADNLETIKCPACDKEMVKVFVSSVGINVDICLNGCGGIYFDNKEFRTFEKNHEDIHEIASALEGKTFTQPDESMDRTCPACGQKMVKNFTTLSKEIEVDDCYNCGGKFLDYGEFEKILEQNLNSGERKKELIQHVVSSDEYKSAEKILSTPKKPRSLMKRVFDKIFFGS